MKQLSIKISALILVLAVASWSATVVTYNPIDVAGQILTGNAFGTVGVDAEINEGPRWFRITDNAGVGAANIRYFQFARYDATNAAANKIFRSLLTITGSGIVRAVSDDYTCALVTDVTGATPATATLYRFTAATAIPTRQLIAGTQLVQANAGATDGGIQLSTNCAAFRVKANGKVYRAVDLTLAAAWTYAEDTTFPALAGNANPVFNRDFTFAVNDAGQILKRANANQAAQTWTTIALATTTLSPASATFQITTKKIWTVGSNIVIYSAGTGGAPGGSLNWAVNAFVDGTTIAPVVTNAFQGTFIGTLANIATTAPVVDVSNTLRTVFVVSFNTGGTAIAEGRVIDYTAKTSTTLVLPGTIKVANTIFSISDSFLYLRHTEAATAGTRKHSGYYFSGTACVTMFESQAIADSMVTNSPKVFLTVNDNANNFYVLNEIKGAAAGAGPTLNPLGTSITVEQTIRAVKNSISQWDRTLVAQPSGNNYISTGSLALDGTSVVEGKKEGSYFTSALNAKAYTIGATTFAVGSRRIFVSTTPNLEGKNVIVSLDLTSTASLKASSWSSTCAIIQETASAWKVWNFQSTTNATLSPSTLFADIYTLFSGASPVTGFDISDDCSAIRLGSKVYHWDTSLTPNAYAVDTLPAAPNALFTTNPTFSPDFSIAVNDGGIFTYTPKGAQAGFYSLSRAEIYNPTKQIFTNGLNLIIYHYKVGITAALSDFKVQINTLLTSGWTRVGATDYSAISNGNAAISVSSQLSKYAINGKLSTDATKPLIVLNHIDYVNNVTKTIVSTAATSDLPTILVTEIDIQDSFLYIRNNAASKHSAWVLVSEKATKMFVDQTLDWSWQLNYARTIIVPDASGKFTAFYQINTPGSPVTYTKWLKDQRQTVGQVISPKTIANDFNLNYYSLATSMNQIWSSSGLEYASQQFLGRWIYTTTSNSVLTRQTYDGSLTTSPKARTINSAVQTNTVRIWAVSTAGEAVLAVTTTTAGANTVNIWAITDTAWSAFDASALLIANPTVPQVTAWDLGTTVVQIANAGAGFRVNNFVFHKTSNTPTYAISASLNGWATSSNIVVDNANWRFALATPTVTGTAPAAVLTVAAGTTLTAEWQNTIFQRSDLADWTGPTVAKNIQGLYSNRRIYSSLDSKAVILFSWQPSGANINFIVKMWTFSTVWNAETTIAQGTVAGSDIPMVYYAPSFTTVAVIYNRISTGSLNQYAAVFKKVVIGTGVATDYTVPLDFTQVNTKSMIYLDNDIVQLVSTSTVAGGKNWAVYYVNDNPNARLNEVSRTSYSGLELKNLVATQVTNSTTAATLGHLTVTFFYNDADSKIATVKKFTQLPAGTLNKTRDLVLASQPADYGVLTQADGTVLFCPTGCSSCSDLTYCLACKSGWILQSGSNLCYKCTFPCKTCLSSSYKRLCTECWDGFYVNGITCTRCHDSCATCNAVGPTKCQTCKIGFYFSVIEAIANVGTCSACIDNCAACSDKICTRCDWGYSYNVLLNECSKCAGTCTLCNPFAVSTCLNCADGFRNLTDTTAAKSLVGCEKCISNCQVCADSTTCTTCFAGFKLSAAKTCVDLCYLPCLTCTDADPTKCTACIGGYTLSENVCNPVLTCNTTSPATCTSCTYGYNLIKINCNKCNITYCSTCQTLDINTCATCIFGYYLNGNAVCASCSEGCARCDNDYSCYACSAGFYLSGSKCIKCTSPCATCSSSATNCDSCISGYNPRVFNCQGVYSLKVVMKLAGDHSKFTTQNYKDVEGDLCNTMKISRRDFFLNSLTSGSTVVDATANSGSASQTTAMQNSLNGIKTAGGLAVESFSVTASSDQSTTNNEDADYYRKVAIIVGVVIPVSLIIIFCIIILMQKRGVICSDGSRERQVHQSQMHIQIKNELSSKAINQ